MGHTPYEVDLRAMDALSAADLYALLKMRVDVFVVEQTCPYPELDGKDATALHLRLMEGDVLVASARLLPPKGSGEPARIGRVVVSPDHRRKQLGNAVMREAISACETAFPGAPIALSAQSHLRAFYARLGFEATSDDYVEDGIPHVDMLRQPPPVSLEVA